MKVTKIHGIEVNCSQNSISPESPAGQTLGSPVLTLAVFSMRAINEKRG